MSRAIIVPKNIGLPPTNRMMEAAYYSLWKLGKRDCVVVDVFYKTWITDQTIERRWYALFRRFGDDQIYYVPVLNQTILNGTAGSNQTWTVDPTWSNANNTVEGIGAGASGCSTGSAGANNNMPGGGAGAYNIFNNLNLGVQTTATYQLGAGGVSAAGTGDVNGQAGGKTWFNSTAYPASGQALGANNGAGGTGSASGTAAGGAGGAISGNFPANTGSAGGSAGTCTTTSSDFAASGGGGAGGPNGAGNNSANSTTAATNGGSGDAGVGGAGGNAATSATSGQAVTGGVGSNGNEWSTNNGSGGGGGAAENNATGASNATGGGGGQWGAGGGAAGCLGTGNAGDGANGVIVLTWTPGPIAASPLPAFTNGPGVGISTLIILA